MAAADTAKLLASLQFEDRLTPGVKAAMGSVDKLDRGMQGLSVRTVALGSALGVGIERLAEKGLSSLIGIVSDGTSALRENAVQAAQTAAVIKSTGGAAGVTAQQVVDLANSMQSLDAVDDAVVQHAENVLLTFTKIGSDIFPAVTQAVIDMSAALGTDPQSAALQLGKALNDPTKGLTALTRAGVSFTAQQQEQIKALVKSGDLQKAQAMILREVQTEFHGVAQAQAEADPSKGLALGWQDFEKLLARGILPAVQHVQRTLTGLLADPRVQQGAEDLGRSLGTALEEGLKFAQSVPWDKVASGLEKAAGFAGGLVKAFTSMPPEVQAAIIGLAGLNKLSGGAVTSIASELGKGLIKGVLGINAGVVNVKGAVVNGGAGGLASGAASTGGGLLNAVMKVAIVGIAAGVAVELAGQLGAQSTEIQQQGADLVNQAKTSAPGMSRQDVVNALSQIDKQKWDNFGLNAAALLITNPLNNGLDNLDRTQQALRAQLASMDAGSLLNSPSLTGNTPAILDLSKATRDAGYEVDNAIKQSWASAAAAIVKPLDRLHQDFAVQIGILHKSADPGAVAAAAARAAADVSKGVGSASTTAALLATLRKDRGLVASSGDAKQLAAIDAAIRTVSGKLPNRVWVDKQLDAAKRILASGQTANQKADQLKAIQRTLVQHGDTHAADQIAKLRVIAAKKTSITIPVSIPITTNVSIRDINKGSQTRAVFTGRYSGHVAS